MPKKNLAQTELDRAIDESINMWYARANGIDISKKCPVCRVMKKISSDKTDICSDCFISKHNDNMGCPDDIQRYKETKRDDDRIAIARRVACFIEEAKMALLTGRYI